MPSIELICVQQHEPFSLPQLPFAVCAESVLRSHRGPTPLFQSDFDQLRGCIYHLGSPFCDAPDYEGPFFAYELLSERCQDALPARFLEFAPEFLPGITREVPMAHGFAELAVITSAPIPLMVKS